MWIGRQEIQKSEGKTKTCEHLQAVNILWITKNEDGQTAPVIFVDSYQPIFVRLTNQTFYAMCKKCLTLAYGQLPN